ncbi:MAG: YhcH/YjgK/YiaL family protein [Bacteroidetes bacterium]|nr:YhcH/YjgK/YiaL family protein [Bacteroidota bacterium]
MRVNKIVCILLMMLAGRQVFAQEWNKKIADEWFKKEVWQQVKYDGFGRPLEANPLKPHSSINRVLFAEQYHKNKAEWDKAFAYLRDTDLSTVAAGKFTVDGQTVMVSDGRPRMMDTTKWEGHVLYADLQYVYRGREKMGRAEIAKLKPATAYDSVRDIRFYEGDGQYFEVGAGTFCIFFPGEGHRPNLQIDEGTDKKFVVKVRIVP